MMALASAKQRSVATHFASSRPTTSPVGVVVDAVAVVVAVGGVGLGVGVAVAAVVGVGAVVVGTHFASVTANNITC